MATETDAARDRVLEARAVARRGTGGPRGLRPRRGRHPRQDQAQPGEGRRGRRWRRRSSCSAVPNGPSVPAGARSRARRTAPAVDAAQGDRQDAALAGRRRQEGARRPRTRFHRLRQAEAEGSIRAARHSSSCPSPGRCCPVRPRQPRPGCSARTRRASRRGWRRSASGRAHRDDGDGETTADGTATGATVMERAADTDAAKDKGKGKTERCRHGQAGS